MNVKLLEQVKEYILAEPRRLDMDVVMVQSGKGQSCASAGCIDGWAQYLANKDSFDAALKPVDIVSSYDYGYQSGSTALGITKEQAERLFTPPEWAYDDIDNGPQGGPEFGEHWPEEFIEAYVNAENDAQRAEVTAQRIELFIATDGGE